MLLIATATANARTFVSGLTQQTLQPTEADKEDTFGNWVKGISCKFQK